MPLLEVKNLTVHYGTVLALDRVSFHVDEGEIVAIIGPNGAGKSTALRAICGLLPLKGKSSDETTFEGENISGARPYELVRKGICLVPEGRRVFSTMTVLENLQMGAFTLNNKKQIDESLQKVFATFPRLRERQRQRAGTLSSGEQQMLAIGRAIMLEPKLLLIDEPSIGLSPNYVQLVFEKLNEINGDDTAILLVEQNARLALQTSDRSYVFKHGKIAFEGKSQSLLENEKVRKSFLGG
jgi:branched-chain amino acid transport system ATP-binding protein